ncbi:hypothetical protein K0M31_005603 [Melipona bicolor]|uniref:Uncharacterized protein n=1 Tax=Melipona bicolor TaxID=60889 RepID=A0AA40FUH2_9HYME|nr:hypothetical protein K0M31_005603 [Melipona bicolor]
MTIREAKDTTECKEEKIKEQLEETKNAESRRRGRIFKVQNTTNSNKDRNPTKCKIISETSLSIRKRNEANNTRGRNMFNLQHIQEEDLNHTVLECSICDQLTIRKKLSRKIETIGQALIIRNKEDIKRIFKYKKTCFLQG